MSLLVPLSCFSNEIPAGFYHASQKENVPVRVLYAIALNESQAKTNLGRVIAWPYSLNVRGKSFYFNTHEELRTYIYELLREGETSFDVGIAQINYYWHKDSFDSIDDLIDPTKNLEYAARYLKSHYDKTGDWWLSVGKYHAPNNKRLASNYQKRVHKIWLTL